MSLRNLQSIFVLNVAKLIAFAYKNGFELTFGHAERTVDQQLLYFYGYKLMVSKKELKLIKTAPTSKVKSGKHQERLAIDFNIFKDGKLLSKKEDCQELGDYWETLDKRNEWGGNWKNFLDLPHFQMNKK